jgi:uncharacterized protein (DUF1697 family)
VVTFRTSGNVVFEAERSAEAKLTERIETGLASALGFEVPILLRGRSELSRIASERPFRAAQIERSQGKLQVCLLKRRPAKRAADELLALASDSDRLALGRRELYWLPSGGIRDSAVGRSLPKLLGESTMRTKGTIEVLTAKYF